MNLGRLELLLVKRLKSGIGQEARILRGPPTTSPTRGARSTVHVHASGFEDFGRMTLDGVAIARRAVGSGESTSGFAEERPGRIVVDVICTAPAYRQMQRLSAPATTSVLLALETLRSIPLAGSGTQEVNLDFANISPSLHSCTYRKETADDRDRFSGELRFHLDGFLHVTVRLDALKRPRRPD